MPSLYATDEVVWGDATALEGPPLVIVWGDGESRYSDGGTFTPGPPPVGGVPIVPPIPTIGATIPAASTHRSVHTLAVFDDRDDSPLPSVTALTISADADSIYRSLRATCSDDDRATLLAGEQPAVIRVELDGDVWRFAVDSLSRTRQGFPVASNSIAGRSLTVAAAAPYQPEQNWSVIDGPTTAAQIAAIANLYTGVEVAWELEDWSIPAGVFSFSGTPLLVVKAVADAVRGILLSDRAEPKVRVIPRYPVLPNEWASMAPDVEIHASAIRTDSVARNDKPPYNGIVVSGLQGGALGFVRLGGTNGGVLHPMVSDVLMTDEPALRQRGAADLGESGEQVTVTVDLPVVYGTGRPGVVEVGALVRFVGDGAPWVGLVRSSTVNVAFPTITQTLALEQHTKPVGGTVDEPPPAVPIDPFFESVVLLLHMDGEPGQTTWDDASNSDHEVETVGAPIVSDAMTLFDGNCTYFDGNGSILWVADSTDWEFGTDDFTWECWLYAVGSYSVPRSAFGSAVGTGFYPILVYRNVTQLNARAGFANSTTQLISSTTPALESGVWTYVVVQQREGQLDVYTDGVRAVLGAQTVAPDAIYNPGAPLCIGNLSKDYNGGAGVDRAWYGYMRELRITRAARYAEDFTPPTAPWPEIGPT